jgi:uncharacterized protein (TIGR02231 family)
LTSTALGLVSHHPSLDEQRASIPLPVVAVTLLEDRAHITRRGSVELVAGRNRLQVYDVAPTLQDVSLRVSAVGPARVDDARARRAARVRRSEKPEQAQILEDKLDELAERHTELRDDVSRLKSRAGVVTEMTQKALAELPQDAAWSIGDAAAWKQTFETLSQKSRRLLERAQQTRRELRTVSAAAEFVVAERERIDRPEVAVLCVLEIDIFANAAGSVELVAEYTVPNAIWRPTHEAALVAETLTIRSRAAVWQYTGEDWNNVALSFSTARSSLGHEPPLLRDDVLAVRKRDTRVVVQAREVAVTKAGHGRGEPSRSEGAGSALTAPTAVDLPGVDDGGDIQNMKAAQPMSVPSNGRPVFVDLSSFLAPASRSLIVMAEADQKAFMKASCTHRGSHPLLAGPVDLLMESGPVGSTRTLFVAPGEQLAIGFGPDDDLRVRRTIEVKEAVDDVDQWRRRTVTVNIYLSNLGAAPKDVELVERLPVSEVDHATVTLLSDKTSGAPSLDQDGFARWNLSVAGHGRLRLTLVYVVAFAPNVTLG